MSTPEVIESTATELETIDEPALPSNLFRTDDPAQVLQRAQDTANALMPVVRQRGLISNIQGRDHLRVEAWQTLGAMLGVTSVCEWTRKVDEGWEARVEARTLDGRTIGAAEAQCLRAESTWRTRDDYAIRSMAQTRATSKALASVLRFVATLGGAEGTPAEEMPQGGSQGGSRGASDKQLKFLFGDGNRPGLFDDAGVDPGERPSLIRWITKAPLDDLSAKDASGLIEALAGPKDGPKPTKAEKQAWAKGWKDTLAAGIEARDPHALAALELQSDVPADTQGLEVNGLDETLSDPVPFDEHPVDDFS